MTKKPLSPEVYARMSQAAKQGREAWRRGDIPAAERHFVEAWNTLPEPKSEQDYAQSLAWGLVEFYRDTKQCEKATQWLRALRELYGPHSDSSLDFLAGTVAFECEDLDTAFRLFRQLYLEFGKRPFEGSDPKYLDFYERRFGPLSGRTPQDGL
jgi:hypothetical protein